jgi:hypothetical protein
MPSIGSTVQRRPAISAARRSAAREAARDSPGSWHTLASTAVGKPNAAQVTACHGTASGHTRGVLRTGRCGRRESKKMEPPMHTDGSESGMAVHGGYRHNRSWRAVSERWSLSHRCPSVCIGGSICFPACRTRPGRLVVPASKTPCTCTNHRQRIASAAALLPRCEPAEQNPNTNSARCGERGGSASALHGGDKTPCTNSARRTRHRKKNSKQMQKGCTQNTQMGLGPARCWTADTAQPHPGTLHQCRSPRPIGVFCVHPFCICVKKLD